MTRLSHHRLWLGAIVVTMVLAALYISDRAGLAEAACSLPTTAGTATVANLSVPTTGNYRLWARLISPSAGKSAVYLQVDNSYCNLSLGGDNIPVGLLTWVDYLNATPSNKLTLSNLTAGTHQITLAGKDPGVSVDKVLLLTDLACVPSGDGSNCQVSGTPTPSPGVTPAPTPSPVVIPPVPPSTPPVVSGQINLSSSSSLSDTKYLVDGKAQDGSVVDTTKLSDGLHTVSVTGIDANGNAITNSETIQVKNHANLVDRLVSFWQHDVVGVVVVVVLLAIVGGLWWHRRSRFIVPLLHRLSPVSSHLAEAPHVPAPPPSAEMIYPDGSDSQINPPEQR